ncbi:Zn-dependent exopeptidase [Peniophora sp. CONT]|nr:Zn-dependent exopeptidase [Peniophora sp. CONT]
MIAKLASGLSLLTVLSHNAPEVNYDPCLRSSYLGTYGSQSVFMPRMSCYTERGLTSLLGKLDADIPSLNDGDALVWVEEASIDYDLLSGPWPSVLGVSAYLELLDTLSGEVQYGSNSAQETLALPASYKVLHQTERTALLALPQQLAYQLSDVLPPTWKLYALPSEPLELAAFSLAPASEELLGPVRAALSNLKFNPDVARIVDSIDSKQMLADVQWLSGEDPESPIVSRHSFSEGSRQAADWLKDEIESTGAICELRPFLIGFAPNVICRYPSTVNTTGTVLISGHYDSRGSFGSPRAPGADDDGSGTTGVLNIARTIGKLGVTFRSNVEIVTFAGEEQGLYGSRYYSKDLKEEGKNLTLMIQADMTAYHVPGEPMQLGLPETIGTPEVTQLVANITAIYAPELKVGYSSACCSDHQSFWSQGFPASQVFERAGPIADPMYHNSGDLSERVGYDVEQARSIAKVQFATILHTAGFDLP